jgi:hypothetical protein
MRSLFGRHEAPILEVSTLASGESVLIVSGLVPNRRGQPVVHRWYGAVFRGAVFDRLEAFEAVLERTRLGAEPLANTGRAPGDLQQLVPIAVDMVRERVLADRQEEEKKRSARLEEMRAELKKLRARKEAQIELDLEGKRTHGQERQELRRGVHRVFDEFENWVQETLATEAQPFLQVIAVLRGTPK